MIIIIPLLIVVGVLAWVLRPGKKPSNPRRIVILVTAVSSLIVAITAVVFQLLHNTAGKVEVSDISNTLFVIGVGLVVAAVLASIVLAFMRKGEVARGTGFGMCIAVVISIIELGLLEWLGGV